jgi:hypothetical protein
MKAELDQFDSDDDKVILQPYGVDEQLRNDIVYEPAFFD